MWLREHRSAPRSLADLLNWGALVAPGVLLQKDGSFLAGWRYRGPDLDSATPEELAALVEQVNRAFLAFGEDAAIHVDAIRRPSPAYPGGGQFPDPVTALIDEERRRQYEHTSQPGVSTAYETEYTLVLAQLPPAEAKSRFLRLFLTGDEDHLPTALPDSSVRSSTPSRTTSEERWTSPARRCCATDPPTECLTALSIRWPYRPPLVTSTSSLQPGLRRRSSLASVPTHLAVIAAMGLPLESQPGLLDHLTRLPIPTAVDAVLPEAHTRRRSSTACSATGGRSARAWAASCATSSAARRPRQRGPRPHRDAVRMAEDAEGAAGEAASGLVRYGYYTNASSLPTRIAPSCRPGPARAQDAPHTASPAGSKTSTRWMPGRVAPRARLPNVRRP